MEFNDTPPEQPDRYGQDDNPDHDADAYTEAITSGIGDITSDDWDIGELLDAPRETMEATEATKTAVADAIRERSLAAGTSPMGYANYLQGTHKGEPESALVRWDPYALDDNPEVRGEVRIGKDDLTGLGEIYTLRIDENGGTQIEHEVIMAETRPLPPATADYQALPKDPAVAAREQELADEIRKLGLNSASEQDLKDLLDRLRTYKGKEDRQA